MMLEVAKAFGFTGFGIFLGLVYARHGWKKYYEGLRAERSKVGGSKAEGGRMAK